MDELMPKSSHNSSGATLKGRVTDDVTLWLIRIAVIPLLALGLVTVENRLAAANPLPRYDPPGYCMQVADVDGGSSQILNTCIGQEQESYDSLKARWASIPARMQAYCDDVARAVGGTYQILKACLEQEAEADRSMPEFEF